VSDLPLGWPFRWRPRDRLLSKEEIEAWRQKCPIKRLKQELIREGALAEQEFEKMSSDVYSELDEVAKRA
jgi:pyruvate dehydrogenase E1 component alpha subunit